MKIDSIDIRSFDAKQLTVDFEPPQTGVTVEMFDGALIPSESETYTPLSGLTVTVLFRDFNPRSHEGSDINFHQKVLFSLSKNCLIHLFFITNFLN